MSKLTPKQMIEVTIKARGTTTRKRFAPGERELADRMAQGWRKQGAQATVATITINPPKPALDGINADFAGPDSKWGGWDAAGTWEALEDNGVNDAALDEYFATIYGIVK